MTDIVADASRGAHLDGMYNSIAIGDSVGVFGGGCMFIGNDVPHIYWNTAFESVPNSVTHHAPSGMGTNKPGGDFSIVAGRGTGTGAGGSIVFYTSPAGTTGSVAQLATEMGRFDPIGFSVPCIISASEPTTMRAGMLWLDI
jgi:hypothetical protein